MKAIAYFPAQTVSAVEEDVTMNDELGSTELNPTISSELINIQINAYDFYQRTPSVLDTDHGNSLPNHIFGQVPIIRVYGSLPTGHKVLCHIHGISPYIFIRYDGQQDDTLNEMHKKCSQLHKLLEIKMRNAYELKKRANHPEEHSTYNVNSEFLEDGAPNNIAYGTHQNDDKQNTLNYISNVSVVRAIPFYGFHVHWSSFFKISLLSPTYVNKLSELLRDGKITGETIDTFESHVPYLLQFSADYNLFGCSWLKLDTCYFRQPILNSVCQRNELLKTEKLYAFLDSFVDRRKNVLPQKDFERVGNSLLEIDILPQFIKNREEIDFRETFYNSGCEQETEEQVSHISSTRDLWKEIRFQRSVYRLDKYRPPLDIERTNEPNLWQDNDEILRLLEIAKEKIKAHELSLRKRKCFFHSLPGSELLPEPRTALTEIWPKVIQDVSAKNPSQLPSLIKDYPLHTTNNVEHDRIESTRSDAENIESSIEEWRKTPSIEQMSSRICTSDGSKSSDTNLETITDLSFTQDMARKREKDFNDLTLTSSSLEKTKRPKKIFPGIQNRNNTFEYKAADVQFNSILLSLETEGFPKYAYQDPYFSEPSDLKKEYAYSGRKFHIQSPHLSSRSVIKFQDKPFYLSEAANNSLYKSWLYIPKPPSYNEILECSNEYTNSSILKMNIPTHDKNTSCKRSSGTPVRDKRSQSYSNLTHLSLEIHASTRGGLSPDSAVDSVQLIFWKIEEGTFPADVHISNEGIMVVLEEQRKNIKSTLKHICSPTPLALYNSELEMLRALAELVLLFDPDILSGFELNSFSWGYIVERCHKAYDYDFCDNIARVSCEYLKNVGDQWGYTHASSIRIPGRHMLNIWRTLRSELNISRYTIENATFYVLNERIPHFSHKKLTQMWNSNDLPSLMTFINYWKQRLNNNIRLLKKLSIISRTTEQARLIGIDFYSVFYRGSQFKVESILVRLCKSEHFMLLSPSKKQVREQKPLECVPLVMEPISALYKSPLVVLDFQALYPSIIIAYNYCYSTVIGRVRELGFQNEVGTTKINVAENFSSLLEDNVTVSPNGVLFVKKKVRESILAKMLKEILDTRVMVKSTMNDINGLDEDLSKLLNNRQLALKLLANVTYGYTSASFSGRMPCSDVADSIVQTGRETLEKAIALIEENSRWGAKVVYGDTDSLFVYLPGKSKDEAFRLGKEMAQVVTEKNPSPVRLKFEKIYHPSILISKKRYVGYSYEKKNQIVPKFDAKGIETVRRDGYPAQQKILEKSLRLLFETMNLSEVKGYVQDQLRKLNSGDVSIQDYCFAREVKLGKYKSEKTAPPGAAVARRQMEKGHRSEPQYRERVPYLVIKGKLGQVLRERCVSPEEFISHNGYELDSQYYIMKTLLPPLSRVFNLIGVDVYEWNQEISSSKNFLQGKPRESNTLRGFVKSRLCLNCHKDFKAEENFDLCAGCEKNRIGTTINLLQKQFSKQVEMKRLLLICRSCCNQIVRSSICDANRFALECDSQDCPVYFSRAKSEKNLTAADYHDVSKVLMELNDW